MCKRLFITLCVVFCVTSIMPLCVFAEDLSSDSSTSEQSTLDGLGSDLNSAVEEHGNGIADAFDNVKSAWDDAVGGIVEVAGFMNETVSFVLGLVPAFTVYIVLFVLVLSAFAVLKALGG